MIKFKMGGGTVYIEPTEMAAFYDNERIKNKTQIRMKGSFTFEVDEPISEVLKKYMDTGFAVWEGEPEE